MKLSKMHLPKKSSQTETLKRGKVFSEEEVQKLIRERVQGKKM